MNMQFPLSDLFGVLSAGSMVTRYTNKYEAPLTPYQRLLDSDQVSQDAKKSLKAVYNSLNPFKLNRRIDEKLKTVFNLVWLPHS